MSEIENIKLVIGEQPLFHECRGELIDRLAARGRIIKATKGQVFFIHSEEALNFYVITKGWVKLFRETLDGTQAVVDILPAGHMFGETSIFENEEYPYSAEATEQVEVLSLPISILKDEINEHPEFARSMLKTMARYRSQQDKEIEHRTLQNASQRIGCFMLKLAEQNSNGEVVINLPYDKSLVASRLGMQPETFSRALSKLKSATGMKVRGGTIILENFENLTAYCCVACTSHFPCKEIA